MACPCDDTKRKMPRCDAGTPPVLEVHSKECPVLFHTVTIPASIGDLESMPPTPGAHRNARVIYEADNATYLYDSDGIPQLLVPDTESIIAEAVSQIPVATSGSNGLMSGADKSKLDGLYPNNYSTTERVVGKWIDGRNIYAKTFEFTGLTAQANNSVNVGPHGITNFEKALRIETQYRLRWAQNNYFTSERLCASGICFHLEQTNIFLDCAGSTAWSGNYTMTVFYIKTTD